jgi:hypothetical protein
MPQPIPVPIRQQIWKRVQQGEDAAMIAAALRLRPRTVQHLVRRFRQCGSSALSPDYHAPSRQPSVCEHLIQEAVCLHQEHPTWGAGFIRVRLGIRHPKHVLPSERTLQRHFQLARQAPAPPGRKPTSERIPAEGPHHVWQMDASERIPLSTGQCVSWLRCVDEFTGAVLGTRVFPPRGLESSAGDRHATVSSPAI